MKHLIFHTKTFLSVSLIAVFLAFSSINLQAQKDSVYVTKSSLDRTIGLELKYKTHFTSIQQQNLPDIRLHNQSILLGLRVRYKIVNLAVSFPIYSFQENNNSFIDAYGAFLKAYPKNSLITGQFKYLPLKSIEWVPSFGKLSETIQNTAYLFQSNILASYSFKGSKLSFSSVYSFVDRQKKTAGSWLVTSSLDYYALVATRPDFEEKAFNFYTLENLNKLRLGLGGGYTQFLVWKNFTFQGFASGGIEYVKDGFKIENQAFESNTTFNINPRIHVLGAVIYYFNDYFIACTGEYIPDFKTASTYQLFNEEYYIRFAFGRYL